MVNYFIFIAPDGCLQYYTEETGSIESFNWPMQHSPYPALTNYAICIKRHQTNLASYCGITFAAATQGDGKMFCLVHRPINVNYIIFQICIQI